MIKPLPENLQIV